MDLAGAVRDKRADVLALCRKHGATNVRLFGSAARGEASARSDVDLLVVFGEDRSIFDHVALKQALEDLLDVPVDVVTEGALSGTVRDAVLREAVPV